MYVLLFIILDVEKTEAQEKYLVEDAISRLSEQFIFYAYHRKSFNFYLLLFMQLNRIERYQNSVMIWKERQKKSRFNKKS